MTQEIKRHVVLVAFDANHNDSEIATFLNVAGYFTFKVMKQLITSSGHVTSLAERNKHS